jgi:hypothetical protein
MINIKIIQQVDKIPNSKVTDKYLQVEQVLTSNLS